MGFFSLFYPWGVLLQVLAIVHFLRRRPETVWLYVILFLGPVGALIYIVVEMVPDLGLLRHVVDGFGRRKRISRLEAVVLQNPSAGNYEELADLYLEEGRFARARECYDKAISPRTAHHDPIYRRAIAAMAMNDFAPAVTDLEQVTAREPKYDSHRAVALLAHAYANTGRAEEAETLFRQATAMSTLPETYINYATFLAGQNRPAEARQWAEAVLASRPAMPRYLQRRERPWFRKADALLKRLRRGVFTSVLCAVVSGVTMAGAVALQADDRPRVRANASGLIPYFIAEGVAGSRARRGDVDLAVWALEEWARQSGGLLRFERVDRPEAARILVDWLPWAEDAALGRMDASTVNGDTVASITVRPDEDRFRPSVKRRVTVDPLMRDVVLYFVCLHEIGHALGLSHSHNPRDIMWPGANGVTLPVYERYRHRLQIREDISRTSWLSRDDVGRFRTLWGGEPLAQ